MDGMGVSIRLTPFGGGGLQTALAENDLEAQLPLPTELVCHSLLHTPLPGSLCRYRVHVGDWLDVEKVGLPALLHGVSKFSFLKPHQLEAAPADSWIGRAG